MGLGKKLIMPQPTGGTDVDSTDLKVWYDTDNSTSFPGNSYTLYSIVDYPYDPNGGFVGYNLTQLGTYSSNGYITMDGGSQEVRVAHDADFSIPSNALRTFSIWCRNHGNSSAEVLYSKGGYNNWEYALFIYGSGSNQGCGFASYANGATNIAAAAYGTGDISANTWHNIVVTVDFTTNEVAKLYIDGSLVTTDTGFPYSAYTRTQSFIIGDRDDLSWNFDGDVGDFRLYTRLWSADEVLQYYNFSKADYGL